MCTGATAGGSLAWQACLAQQARNGSPSEIASTTAFWKEAWGCQNTAQNPTGLGERTMQSMCTAWLPWTEPASGTHADHPRLCGAAPPCLPENPMNSRQQSQKMKMGKACPDRHTASRCLQPNCHIGFCCSFQAEASLQALLDSIRGQIVKLVPRQARHPAEIIC